MIIKQLSLFLENKPGSLGAPCRLLANAGINILTLTLADSEKFGILRLIIREWERAQKLLETAGYVANVTDVVAVEVADRPGGMASVLEALHKHQVNVEYLYAFTIKHAHKALADHGVLVFRFKDPSAGIQALHAEGLKGLDEKDLAAFIYG
jgi:hypothetical protein